jgi:EAL and modified HD-GYP domain-containing signal transduction protein
MATRTMLDNTVMFGMEKLAGGAAAFVNCTCESLTEELVDVMPPAQTVLEVLEDLEPTPCLVEACRKLKESGFRLALDDFIWRDGIEPLVDLADFIKVDFLQSGSDERQQLLSRLKGRPIQFLAEKVETQEEYEQACKEGFTLFQGYFFCRPVLLQNRKVPANRLSQIEILRMLRDDAIDMRQLTAAVKRDASLTYRLLRLINSPLYAQRREVQSVHAALVAIGIETFRRIATLAIASEMNSGQPDELLRMAFVRARFCELAAGPLGMDPTEQYLLGLLSLLPAMLRVPMEELTPALPLRPEIQLALKGEDVSEARLLRWLEHHERADWSASDRLVIEGAKLQNQLANIYTDALEWAQIALPFA